MKEEILERRVIFDGEVIKVYVDKVKLPDGKEGKREIVERIDGVSILPIIDNNKVLLIKQYRYAQGKVVWRLPGGGINGPIGNPTEESKDTAQRELFEETGYKARKLELLFISGGSGTIKQKVYHYLATELYKPNNARKLDKEEFLSIHPTPLADALKMAKRAEFLNPAFSLMIIIAEERLRNR
mgnify:CR=1 FL=1